MDNLQYVGLDVHKESIKALVLEGRNGGSELEKTLRNERAKIKAFFERLKDQGSVVVCYEAGCMGFELQRMLENMGVRCLVAAPGLVPRRPGERIRTDRRDARKLAVHLRSGELTFIAIPTREDEGVRDYLRMHEDFKSDLKKTKLRLLNLLLRHNIIYKAGNHWTGKHELWLKSLSFDDPQLKETFDEYFFQLKDLEEKIARIKERIEQIALKDRYKEKVEKLKCFKGIETLTALSFIVEVGDFRRFMKAEEFMAFLGLVPSEDSTGEKRRQGGITKAGNVHLRKLLIEAGWHYQYYNAVSKRLAARRRGQDASLIAYANKAGRRLSKKFSRMIFRHKKPQIAVTAVARELAGFLWGMMVGQTT
jgi:transposase